jgi:hypothetical protein
MRHVRLAVAVTIGVWWCARLDLSLLGQSPQDRFWLAGRYDGDRIIVYFDAVKFGDTFPEDAERIAPPIAHAFFGPMGLPPAYVARFQKERFSLGDRYEMLAGYGLSAMVTLTTLVGFQSDEGSGNDSYIGALATPDRPQSLLFANNYYVVRRLVEQPPVTGPRRYEREPRGWLDPDPVPFDIQSKAASLMAERLKTIARPEAREAANLSPKLSVQRFLLADGGARYFVWADWQAPSASQSIIQLGAWMSASPDFRLLALERPRVRDGLGKTAVMNAVDLGNGRTGIIVYMEGLARGVQLLEYRDGVATTGMRVLHSVVFGD